MKRKRYNRYSRYQTVRDSASLTCTATLNPLSTNTPIVVNGTNLSQFSRAVAVAKGYQRYRITGLKLTFKPAYDTYAQNTGALQKPYMYYIIDKSDMIPNTFTLEALKQAGAKPRALDEKPISIFWRPSVVNESEQGGTAIAGVSYKVSPWLSTNIDNNTATWNPSTVLHLGAKIYFDQAGGNSTVNAEMEVQFQFIKPFYYFMPSTVPPQVATIATIDNSPDGIVGGSDGISG